LVRIQGNGFGEWFIENHREADPVSVYERLADALETDMSKKTVVLAVKIYDVFNHIHEGEYLSLPTDVPIPCDLQVERVAASSGIVDNEDGTVMEAWGHVIEEVNDEMERPVSMLRVDSVVWQSGQIISENGDRVGLSRRCLMDYFAEAGLDEDEGERLAREFTSELSETDP
jgi:N-glycosylase/DNA lyase